MTRTCLACSSPLGPRAFGPDSDQRLYCDTECQRNFHTENTNPNGPYYAMTYEEIGAELGISKQAVQKIERIALRKLRKRLERRAVY